jgi:crotonobetainyl-CoA:carnitine CoA-transferase CaiB-like acyl-CoA transferase
VRSIGIDKASPPERRWLAAAKPVELADLTTLTGRANNPSWPGANRPGQTGAMANPAPLQGIRVVDFSRIIAGPLCTQQLADLGAEVIKIEHPVTGDETRSRNPKSDRRGAMFLAYNRSKRSIGIDLASEAGQDLARRLALGADVVIENFRPGVMARLGLGAEELRAAKPQLIFVSVSAYGATSSMRHRPGLDPVLQAESGMMSINGEVDGAPMRHPLSLIDMMTASHATSAICAALLGRAQHGNGDFIDLCLLDIAIATLGNAGLQYLTTGKPPERSGNRHMVAAPIDLFETATEPLYLAMATDRLFADLCTLIGRPELADDERYANPGARTKHRDQLKEEIEAALKTRPASEWLAEAPHLPVGAVRTIDQSLQAPEVLEREMVRQIPEAGGPVSVLGTPFKLTETDLPPFQSPPRLGQHTNEILSSVLSLTETQIEALRQAGTVV